MLDASEDDVKNHPGVQLKTNMFQKAVSPEYLAVS